MNMFCDKCGKKYFNSEHFCEFCGNKLSYTKECKRCGRPVTNQLEYCPECGKKKIRTTKYLVIASTAIIGVVFFLIGWLSGYIDW